MRHPVGGVGAHRVETHPVRRLLGRTRNIAVRFSRRIRAFIRSHTRTRVAPTSEISSHRIHESPQPLQDTQDQPTSSTTDESASHAEGTHSIHESNTQIPTTASAASSSPGPSSQPSQPPSPDPPPPKSSPRRPPPECTCSPLCRCKRGAPGRGGTPSSSRCKSMLLSPTQLATVGANDSRDAETNEDAGATWPLAESSATASTAGRWPAGPEQHADRPAGYRLTSDSEISNLVRGMCGEGSCGCLHAGDCDPRRSGEFWITEENEENAEEQGEGEERNEEEILPNGVNGDEKE